VTILAVDGSSRQVPLASKREVADAVLDIVVDRLLDHDAPAGGDRDPRSDL
jgi:hypothetical protein